MTAINLVVAICSAPNAVALMRAIDRAVPGNAIRGQTLPRPQRYGMRQTEATR